MIKKTVLELQRITNEDFKKIKKISLVVVLDDIRSLNNIGSIFRTCDAFIVEHIYLCGITAVPPNADIHKTALGAEDTVLWTYRKNVVETVIELKNTGYRICSVEQVKGSTLLSDFKIDNNEKYALVLGNEVKGVKQEVVDLSDYCIEIPQYGTKHSLNVSISAGIVIWDFFKALYKQLQI